MTYDNSSSSSFAVINKFDIGLNVSDWNQLKDNSVSQWFQDEQNGVFNNTSNNIFLLNNSLNVASYGSITFYEPLKRVVDYNFPDVTQWYWSRFFTESQTWKFLLPQFEIEHSYIFKVGNNVNPKQILLIPFECWMNDAFILNTFDVYPNANSSNWFIVNNSNNSLTIDLNKISELSLKRLILWTQSISLYFDVGDIDRLTSQNYTVDFEFKNDNWELIKVMSPSYLVLNKWNNLTIQFYDAEEDDIYIIAIQSNYVNINAQKSSSSSSVYNVMIQSKIFSNESVKLDFNYTDYYHQDVSLWRNFSIKLNLIQAEPPVFETQLNDLNISRCNPVKYQLPKIIDQGGYSWSVILDSSTPIWITQINNSFIQINPPLIQNDIEETIQVLVKLENEVNAWTDYSFNVVLDPYSAPQLDVKGSIKLSLLDKGVEFKVYSTEDINVVDWNTNDKISWLIFDKDKSLLINNTLN